MVAINQTNTFVVVVFFQFLDTPLLYRNPRVPCSTLPTIDLSKWKDHTQYPEGNSGHHAEQPVEVSMPYGGAQGSAHSNMDQYEASGAPMNAGQAYPPPESYPGGQGGNGAAVDHMSDITNYQGEAYQKSKAA